MKFIQSFCISLGIFKLHPRRPLIPPLLFDQWLIRQAYLYPSSGFQIGTSTTPPHYSALQEVLPSTAQKDS
jgi:hypothetical protein